MTHSKSNASQRAPCLRIAVSIALSAILVFGATAGSVSAAGRGGGGHGGGGHASGGGHGGGARGGGWGGGYYPVPPIVYGSPYYCAPPLVWTLLTGNGYCN